MRNLALFLLLAFIFTIPLENRVTGDFGSIAKWIGVLTFVVWIASALLTNRVRRPHILHGLMALFTLWVGISILWSVYDPATATRFQTYMQSLIMSYIMWDLLLKPYQIQWTLWALLGGCYVATLMVLQNFMTGPMFVAYDLRYTVVGFDPNDMGVMLALGIPIAWWLASETSDKSPKRVVTWLVLFVYSGRHILGDIDGESHCALGTDPGLPICDRVGVATQLVYAHRDSCGASCVGHFSYAVHSSDIHRPVGATR